MRHVNMLDLSRKYREHKFEKFTISNGDFDLPLARLTDIVTENSRNIIEGIIGKKLVEFYSTSMSATKDMMHKKLKEMFKAQIPFASITIGRDTLFDGILDNGYSTSAEGSMNAITMDILRVMRMTEKDGLIVYDQDSDKNFCIEVGLSTVTSSFQVMVLVESKQIAYHLSKSWEFKHRTGYRYNLIKEISEDAFKRVVEVPYELPCVIPNVIIKNFCDALEIDFTKPEEVIAKINHYTSVNIYLRTDASVDKPVYMFNYPVSLEMEFESNEYNDFNVEGVVTNKAAVRRNMFIRYIVPSFFRFSTPISTLDLSADENYVTPDVNTMTLKVPTYDMKPMIGEHMTKVDKVEFVFEDNDISREEGSIDLNDIISAVELGDYVKFMMRERKDIRDVIQFDYVTHDNRDVQSTDSDSVSIDYTNMKITDNKAKVGLRSFVFVYIDTTEHKRYQIKSKIMEREKDVEISTL